MTRGEAEQLVGILAAAHPSVQLSDATIQVYVSSILDLDHVKAEHAVSVLIREHPKFPAVSEIRAVADEGGMWALRGLTPDEIERWFDEIKPSLAPLGYTFDYGYDR